MGQRVFTALIQYRARLADPLGTFDPTPAWSTSFTLWMEEEFWIHRVARSQNLPIPKIYECALYILDASYHNHVLTMPLRAIYHIHNLL